MEIRDIKSKLEAINEEIYRGAFGRARADKMWFGETPTKRALGEEKRYAQRNEIKEISFRGETVSDSEKIREAFVDYYNMLLGENVPMGEGFRSEFSLFMPKLDEQERE